MTTRPAPLTVLVHGPITPFTARTLAEAIRARRQGRVDAVVLSTYADATLPTEATGDEVTVVRSADVQNPGFFNINRQVNLVAAGLKAVSDGHVVIKMRSDQTASYKAIVNLLAVRDHRIADGAIFITDCFTRTDRRYHPADMLLIAAKKSLVEYYSLGTIPETHLDDVLAIREDLRNGHITDIRSIHSWPEARLFTNYLRARGEQIEDTDAHSAAMVSKYCELMSASSIGMRWEKFFHGRLPLVPYDFTMAPFEGGPVEVCRCVPTSRSRTRQLAKRALGRVLWGDRLAKLRV